jgi:glycosyltransferase involved in cell wall biosynthesis
MRVLWLSHLVPHPPAGGVLQRSYHLLRELAAEFEVHLVALRQRAICPDEASLEAATAALSEFCASVRVFPLDWETGFLPKAALALRVGTGVSTYDVARFHSKQAYRCLMSGELPAVDVAHFDTVGLIPYARHVSAHAKVLNHHNIESHMMARRASREKNPVRRALFWLQSRQLRALEREAAPRFGCNLVVSSIDGERLASLAGDASIALVPNGVDTDFFDRPTCTDPDAQGIVFVGGHGWYPNRDAVIYFLDEIWPRIVARAPRATFTMIGRAPCQRALDAARDDPRVRVLGFVNDLRDEVARSAVYVMPFRDGGGTRLKLLDGLSLRCAIVSTRLGAEGVPVEDRRHCLCADDPTSFADRVLELLGDPGLRERLGSEGRELVRAGFDWSVVGQRIRSAFREAHALATKRRELGADA